MSARVKPRTDEPQPAAAPAPTTALAVRPPMLPMNTTADAMQLATAFAHAGVLGAKNVAEGVLALKVIQEVGIIAANERYNLMMGRLSKKASAICADFISAGGAYRIVRRDPEVAELVASFGETRDMTFRFTWEEAQQEPFVYAGSPRDQQAALKLPVEKRVLKDKYATPRSRMQMLWARVVSDMGTALCPRCTEGLYPPEVSGDFDDEQGERRSGPIGVEEAVRRAKEVVAVVGPAPGEAGTAPEPEPATEAPVVDATRCPDGFGAWSGKLWSEFPDDVLAQAAASAKLTPAHRASAQFVQAQRAKGGAA